jgi:AraC-like DNA-binding protein
MTARVSSLTERARGRAPAPAATRGQALSGIRPIVDAFVRLGCSRDALLSIAGLTLRDWEDPDGILSDAACTALFCEAGRVLARPNLPLLVAEQIALGAFPLLDYLVLTSESVGHGLRHLARYLRLGNSPTELAIREEPGRVRVVAEAGNPFSNEFTLSLAVIHLRRETDDRFRATRLTFRHRVNDEANYAQRLGCGIQCAAEEDALIISRAAWNLPLRRRDSVLQGVLRGQADDLLARRESDGTFASEIRRALRPRVAGGNVSLAAVSRLLATSPRTLQRRLAAERVSYQEVLDDVRREAAEHYLGDASLSVGEIGYLLGFSEPAAFHRAFKRWTGITPLELRRARRG